MGTSDCSPRLLGETLPLLTKASYLFIESRTDRMNPIVKHLYLFALYILSKTYIVVPNGGFIY